MNNNPRRPIFSETTTIYTPNKTKLRHPMKSYEIFLVTHSDFSPQLVAHK